jgi:FtsZ-interacting cell division protein ZipA
MPELRWTLLIIGAVFIVALALWEFRRQRQVPRQPANPRTAGSDRGAPAFDSGGEPPRVHREPTISLPELQPEPSLESRFTARTREPAQDPPVVEVDDAAFANLKVEGETVDPELPDDVTAGVADSLDPALAGPDYEDTDTVAIRTLDPDEVDTAYGMSDDDEPGPARGVSRGGRGDASRNAASDSVRGGISGGATQNVAPGGAKVSPAEEASLRGRVLTDDSPTGFVSDNDAPEPHEAQAPAPNASERHSVGATAAGAPVVDWPGESSRKIVALRLVSHPASPFQGRAVRQALAAEGFVLGKFDIFHKAGPDDRAVLSAASLTKPGTFAMNTIDAQRFGGISLFAVLPGPLPAQQTFDELLSTARNLNDRLQGALQDERGEPLTPTRSASIRQSLSEGSGSPGAPTAPTSETRQ